MNAIRSKPLRGASTICQQTARTLFLVPIAAAGCAKGWKPISPCCSKRLWPKKRILEAYLNLVDWGHGNFGAEAAARAYFDTDAAALTREPGGAAGRDPARSRQMEARPQPGPYVAGRAADPDRPGRRW